MLIMPSLDAQSSLPHYIQLYEYIKKEIIAGRLEVHDRLPSIRKLADFLSISTTPVEMAYQQLLAEGFIESRPKSGYFVNELPESYFTKIKNEVLNPLSFIEEEHSYLYDFHLSKNDFTLFPFQIWKRLYSQTLHKDSQELLFYGNPQGELGLRKAIARYLHDFRGVNCTPGQIIIGAEQHLLISIASRILKKYTKIIAVENPGYKLIPETFKHNGFSLCPLPLDDGGLNIEALYKSPARIAAVSPSHQFPRGMTMPISTRLKLLDWARITQGFIIEDDYDGEFRYHGRPIPSLQGLAPDSRVIYIGGFSQIVAPALCIHYLVLPDELLPHYHQLRIETMFEQSSSRLHQRVLQVFIEQGHLEKHIRKMRNIYRRKHDRIIESIKQHFGQKARIIGKDAGFHLLLAINTNASEKLLLELAANAGIHISSASFTWIDNPGGRIKEFFLGFAGIPFETIDDGIRLLKEVWDKLLEDF
ncbi:PLP-dependent aminotransferase family protein [Bacillus sp. M6-12]|uniref:MocR-like pyridoxine biosynthesis transcription factor PdxR n=1 Tax=Bacillus sp. M6-12 TaxID=2054166 RepID=UPI000C78B34B|nr:PLP-dependent aminotransferase family protein [Bacillus sp. M6-12]PLS15932.1 PLP-dependent aminotransferase family protein [Bacillus sp. M6-12]